MPSENSQPQKNKYYMVPCIQNILIGRALETESRLVVDRGRRRGAWRAIANGCEVSF